MDAMFTAFFGEGIWATLQAVLILILAFISAAIVKSLVVKLLTKTRLQTLMGRRDPESYQKVAEFIGKLLHLIVFLLFVPGIFEHLGMKSVSSPILGLLDTMWGYLPNILAAVVILWVGFFIAKLVRELLVPAFDRINVNRLQEKAGINVEGFPQPVQHTGLHCICVDPDSSYHYRSAGIEHQRNLRPGHSDAGYHLCIHS